MRMLEMGMTVDALDIPMNVIGVLVILQFVI